MTRVLAMANQKGGVGKTTTAVNLAASLTATRRRVLLVDLDPQGNATMGSGIEKRSLERSVYHVLLGACPLVEARQTSAAGHYDVLPSNRELAGAEVELVPMYMLISVWGTGRKEYSAMKFVLYTMIGRLTRMF